MGYSTRCLLPTQVDAERFRDELVERLGKFSIEVEPSKTKVIDFGRFAVSNAKQKGREQRRLIFYALLNIAEQEDAVMGFG